MCDMGDKIIFFNIGWMDKYCGVKIGDSILGGGSYVEKNKIGHEMFNFEPIHGKMYGFVETKTTSIDSGRNQLHIEKIDSYYKDKDFIDGVLVVWIAKNPDTKGTYIVGWYKNATVFRTERRNIDREYNGEKFGYFATANEENCCLLPLDQRTKEIFRAKEKGIGWIGQSNIWYANHPYVAKFRREIVNYINKKNVSDDDRQIQYSKDHIIKTSKSISSKITSSIPPSPSANEIERYLAKWDSLENYTLQESSLKKLFTQTYPSNKLLDDVLIKVCSLNDFYSTNIFSPYTVAKHIVNLDIDNDLENGNLDIVNRISTIKMNGGKIKNFYSFATKYCSHHKPKTYPIYDSYVDKILMHFKKIDHFDDFSKKDLKSYPKFRNTLEKFRKFYVLDKYNLKQIDKYLWQLGKEYFPQKY